MNRYELTYIINAELEETARKELIEKFSGLIVQNGGEVEKVDETWGKRRLAYPINDLLEGYYVLVTFQSEGDLPREIERNLEINEYVLRYLIIKLVEKKQSVKPRPVRVHAPAQAPAEMGAPAAEVVEVEAVPAPAEAEAPAVEVVEVEVVQAHAETEAPAVEVVEIEAVQAEEIPAGSAE